LMKELLVISGKGGTGKTSIVASFAALAHSKVMADLDVDAADLHLLLKPLVSEAHDFWSGQVALIDRGLCTGCGICQEHCRFQAISTDNVVDPIACEGCGFCESLCPADAITMKDCLSGNWYISDTIHGPMVHARLGIAQENSGKLVALVRQQASQLAIERNLDYIIADGPPGIGCPVISSLSGVDLVLIVTEPTLSGIHDLRRVVDLCRHFNIPARVCLNKSDINEKNAVHIEQICRDCGAPVIALIPYDGIVNESLAAGMPLVTYSSGKIASIIRELWNNVEALLAEPSDASGGTDPVQSAVQRR